MVRTNASPGGKGGGRLQIDRHGYRGFRPGAMREIWVYSPRVEGIHLRAVGCPGGIRWSAGATISAEVWAC